MCPGDPLSNGCHPQEQLLRLSSHFHGLCILQNKRYTLCNKKICVFCFKEFHAQQGGADTLFCFVTLPTTISLQAVWKKKTTVKHRNLIICGDFNLTANLQMDFTSPAKGHTPSLRALFHMEDVYNVWHCHPANKKDYTFFLHGHNSLTNRPVCSW